MTEQERQEILDDLMDHYGTDWVNYRDIEEAKLEHDDQA